jgi:hypothetical protein
MSSSASPAPMKFEIQKLEGASNYITWKASTTIYLDYYDCLEVVNDTEPYPTFDEDDQSSNAASSLAPWKDKTATMRIPTSISKDWMHIVSESSTPTCCWSTLQKKINRHNINSVYHLLRSLMNSTMEYSQSIQDFLTGYDQTRSLSSSDHHSGVVSPAVSTPSDGTALHSNV